jgi:thiol-disulfide isomerase/thioredoxin
MPLTKRSRFSIGLGLGLIAAVWVLREPLRRWVTVSATLTNPAPPPELVESMIEKSPDHAAAILAAWNTGKIVHREVAINEIGSLFPPREPLPRDLQTILLTGALDVDMNVRETALRILQNRNDPALAALTLAQLRDPDPQVRLLGLNYFKHISPNIGVPAVVSVLDEKNPLIVVMGLKLLENWSGESFGVKVSETVPSENEKTGLQEFPSGSREKTQAGVARARVWWAAHQAAFLPVHLEIPPAAITERQPVPAEDFSLQAMDGQPVRLSDLRGKIVLINFWTTWCTACVSEMPELLALQKQHGENLVIIGVSLDFVPDDDGEIGGIPSVEEQGVPTTGHAPARTPETLEKVRAKVARTIKARGINYPILLDEKNEVGGRFNGGELPTTVIVDAQGHVRRRFIGTRSLPVFEAMVAAASKPAATEFATNTLVQQNLLGAMATP